MSTFSSLSAFGQTFIPLLLFAEAVLELELFLYLPMLLAQQGGYLQATPVYCRPRPVHTYTRSLCQIL